MQTYKPYLLAAAGLIVAFLTFRDCSRTEPVITEPAKSGATRSEKRNILNTDSLNSATEAKVRHALDSLRQHLDNRYAVELSKYKKQRRKDQDSEADYRAGKVHCDSVIAAKNRTILSSEALLAKHDSTIQSDSLKLASYKREVEAKNAAIGMLTKTIDKAVAGLEDYDKQLNKEKNKLRVYGTAAYETHPINNNLKIGGTATYKRGLVGYQKGIIQNTHEVKAGVLLW